jgi:hypothetical protein
VSRYGAVTATRVGKDLKGSGGHSESFQLEKNGPRIFVNVPDDGSVVNVMDRKTGELTKWGLNGVKANYPMALDEDDHRLFIVMNRFTLSHDSVTYRRSPEVSSTAFDPQPSDLPPVRLMDMGFAVSCPLARHRGPLIRFLFIGSRLCSALLSGPTSRRV